MDLGSIAGMFEPPYGGIVKQIIGLTLFTPSLASVDLDYIPA